MAAKSYGGLDGDVARHFDRLSVRGKVIAEYIWVGGTGSDLRSKSRVLKSKPQSVDDLPIGHFDGAFTGQVCIERIVLQTYGRGWVVRSGLWGFSHPGNGSLTVTGLFAGRGTVFHRLPQAEDVCARYVRFCVHHCATDRGGL